MNHFLASAKAYAALVGSIVTGLLATVPPHTTVFTVLTFIAAVATGLVTFRIPNKPKTAPAAPAAPTTTDKPTA